MKISSWKTGAGKRAKEKVHKLTGEGMSFGVGHQRHAMTGKIIPGRILTLEFDGRTYQVSFDEKETQWVRDRIAGGEF